MPEHQLAVANHYGLMIGLHISKAAAIADPENLDDLERLTGKYPRVRWMLFHNARSYSAWAIERAEKRLRNIPNLWYESSSVCETDAFDGLLSFVDPKRFCYGTDDLPIGVTRGKLIVWGHAWTDISQTNPAFSVSHCDGRFTFVRYEMLRAMRRAAKHAGLTRLQIEDVFHNNAATLIEAIRTDLTTAGF
jgi:glutamate-1-semialdehyde 2,1-aminomutase